MLYNITVLTICPGELIISSYIIITGTAVAVSGKQTGLQLPCRDVQNIEGKTLFCFADCVSRVITIGSDARSFVLVKKILLSVMNILSKSTVMNTLLDAQLNHIICQTL